jgi:hypothetical protein
MRKWLVFGLLLASLLFPSPAGAQGGIKLKSINIELWSEYDQPSMLVINEFTVDESVTLPVDVTVRFPTDGNLTAVAYKENDKLINITDYKGPESRGNWQTVTMTVQSYDPHRIEYYQPLNRNNNKRLFKFSWIGDYTVTDFNVTVQMPSDSTNIVADPAFSETAKSSDGSLLIGMINRGSLKMGQSYEFSLEYERNSETVTLPGNESGIQPSQPVDQNTAGRVSVDNLPYIIGGFGLALIGLALFFYWRSTQAPERKTRKRRRAGAPPEEDNDDEQAYCHECGTRARKGDRFCRTCGSRLRV